MPYLLGIPKTHIIDLAPSPCKGAVHRLWFLIRFLLSLLWYETEWFNKKIRILILMGKCGNWGRILSGMNCPFTQIIISIVASLCTWGSSSYRQHANRRPGSRGGLLHTWLYQVTHWDAQKTNVVPFPLLLCRVSMNIQQPPSCLLCSCNLVPSHHGGTLQPTPPQWTMFLSLNSCVIQS